MKIRLLQTDFTADWSGNWTGVGGDGTVLKENGNEVDNAVQNDATGKFTDKQMKRKLTVTTPTATYNADEWIFSGVDYAAKMIPGFHGNGLERIWYYLGYCR